MNSTAVLMSAERRIELNCQHCMLHLEVELKATSKIELDYTQKLSAQSDSYAV